MNSNRSGKQQKTMLKGENFKQRCHRTKLVLKQSAFFLKLSDIPGHHGFLILRQFITELHSKSKVSFCLVSQNQMTEFCCRLGFIIIILSLITPFVPLSFLLFCPLRPLLRTPTAFPALSPHHAAVNQRE